MAKTKKEGLLSLLPYQKTINMKKILIVEDKEIVYQPLATYFEEKDWKVEIAEDGVIALELLLKDSTNTYNCMLLDLMMNQMDGDELLKELKLKGITPPKTILLSAYTDDLNIDELKSLGVEEVLKKPCDPFIIEETAEKLRKMFSL
jgi:CheY-like chemotaxis protein